jgi:hypothetical protein
VQAVRGAQPDGGNVADVVIQARGFYGPQLADFNTRFIFLRWLGADCWNKASERG